MSRDVFADLEQEGTALESEVRDLDGAGWNAVTTAEGWTVRHQIAHLAWTDHASTLAITGDSRFDWLVGMAGASETFTDETAFDFADESGADLLRRWADGRRHLATLLDGQPPGARLRWFGPPMSARSMATARLMETWAHGVDVLRALGRPIPATDRLWNVCHIGYRTRGYSYLNRGLAAPLDDVFVQLEPPRSQSRTWEWGDAGAPSSVRGPALDFAMVVTRRQAPETTALELTGNAREWLGIAQAFAGPPGRDPGARHQEPATTATTARESSS